MPIDLNDDSESLIFNVERKMLNQIFATSLNLREARQFPEFCQAVGGMAKLEFEHDAAVDALQDWYREGDGD